MNRYLIVLIASFLTLQSFGHKQRYDDCKEDWSELMLAIYKNKVRKYKKLVENGADVNYFTSGDPCRYSLSALAVAVRSQNSGAVKYLLESDKVEYTDFLFTATAYESLEIVTLMIEYGADPNTDLNDYGFTLLMSCASHSSLEIFNEILQYNNDLNKRELKSGYSALMYAASNAEIDKVKILLDKGADKTLTDSKGRTAYDIVKSYTESESISQEDAIVLLPLLKP